MLEDFVRSELPEFAAILSTAEHHIIHSTAHAQLPSEHKT